MKEDIVRDNKERYDELNPYLTPKAKVCGWLLPLSSGSPSSLRPSGPEALFGEAEPFE